MTKVRTISTRSMSKRELEIGRALYPETGYYKPKTRAECVDAPRPCPYVSCQHHLYLDVSSSTGAIKLNFPDLEVMEMTETCALDVADRGGATLEDVSLLMNVTRERVRQIEEEALKRYKASAVIRELESDEPKRRLPLLPPEPATQNEA